MAPELTGLENIPAPKVASTFGTLLSLVIVPPNPFIDAEGRLENPKGVALEVEGPKRVLLPPKGLVAIVGSGVLVVGELTLGLVAAKGVPKPVNLDRVAPEIVELVNMPLADGVFALLKTKPELLAVVALPKVFVVVVGVVGAPLEKPEEGIVVPFPRLENGPVLDAEFELPPKVSVPSEDAFVPAALL